MNLQRLKASLLIHEGFRAKPYADTTGHLTIGYGTNLDVGISERVAMFMLSTELKRLIHEFKKQDWFVPLDDVRQNVILEMGYNLGVDGVLAFKRTIEAIRQKNYKLASEHMLDSKWAKQVGDKCGQRAWRLSRMMYTGEWIDYIGGNG